MSEKSDIQRIQAQLDMTAPPQKQIETLEPCPFCGEVPTRFISGFVCHLRSDCPLGWLEIKEKGWNDRYTYEEFKDAVINGSTRAQPSETPVAEKVRESLEQSILDLSYYIHLATKAKTNNKWIDCEIYKITMTLERLEKALALLDQQAAPINPKDWTEDFSHENGQYTCECCYCKELFMGHKRRVVCKECAKPNPLADLAAKVEAMKGKLRADKEYTHGYSSGFMGGANAALDAVLALIGKAE